MRSTVWTARIVFSNSNPKGTKMSITTKLPSEVKVGDKVRIPGYTAFQIVRSTGFQTLSTARGDFRFSSANWSQPLEVKEA